MELRKDYILNRYCIISEQRKNRPNQFVEVERKEDSLCFFCPGNENKTPLEKGRFQNPDGTWKLRWFNNKFPFLDLTDKFEVSTDNRFFTYSDAYGVHEVLVETPSHIKEMEDFNVDEIKDVLYAYQNRINELINLPHIKYVTVFKNSGKEAGTSVYHSHSQIAATNIVPNEIIEKINAIKKFPNCPYCDILRIEKESLRRCFENTSAVAFTPYASRFNYEIWIMPKRHVKSLNELNSYEMTDIAEHIKNALSKITTITKSYNIFLHYSPIGEDLHLHFEICPRISIYGGFEFASGIIINSVSPENAAKFYRSETEW